MQLSSALATGFASTLAFFSNLAMHNRMHELVRPAPVQDLHSLGTVAMGMLTTKFCKTLARTLLVV